MQPAAIPAEVPFGQTEVDLVRRAAHGDVNAFEMLVTVRADRIHRIARAILGSDPDARDATQDAFLSAWRELPRLRDAEQFDAWLRRIVVNACRTQMRVKGRVREIPMDGTFDPAGPGPLTADQVSGTDALAHAFERLPAEKRAILALHYLQHDSVAAIAGALGIPEGTVKWRLHDARSALERALLAEGEDPR